MITATITPKGELRITAGNETRATLAQWLREGTRARCTIYAELFESYSCNGSYAPFDAGDGNPFVGLTSAPCIAEYLSWDDNGNVTIDGNFWYFADYMIADELHLLARYGVVIFNRSN